MKGIIIRDEEIPRRFNPSGRGRVQFPQWLELKVSADGTKGDCIVYPDTPDNRRIIRERKGRYNAATNGQFADYHFTHRYEVQSGEQVIVIQRIA